jgi:hypothetical protein
MSEPYNRYENEVKYEQIGGKVRVEWKALVGLREG